MKRGESKTRTRRTLGGGTKTVTRSRGYQGSKSRVVEKTTKDNVKTIKSRRRDQSGVRKVKSTSYSGTEFGNQFPLKGREAGNNYKNWDYEYRHSDMPTDKTITMTTKQKFRKKGSLRSENELPKGQSRITETWTKGETFAGEHGNMGGHRRKTSKEFPKVQRKSETYTKKEAKKVFKEKKNELKAPRMSGKAREHYANTMTMPYRHPKSPINLYSKRRQGGDIPVGSKYDKGPSIEQMNKARKEDMNKSKKNK